MTTRGSYELRFGGALEVIPSLDSNAVHAVVTDPPFSLVEYSPEQLEKRRNGRGGDLAIAQELRW